MTFHYNFGTMFLDVIVLKIKKVVIIFFITITIFTICFFLFKPNFYLMNKTSEVSEEYIPKVKVKNAFFDLSSKVVIDNLVDNDKIGTYKIICHLNYFFLSWEKTFEVEVKDSQSPTIELIGPQEVTVCPSKTYEELGYKAIDNYDQDLTDKVNVLKSKDKIVYSVKDNSNNEFTIERKIIYQDLENPVINLKGEKEITIYQGSKYTEMGYEVIDNCDSNLTDKVLITNNLDINKIGEYEITYEVEDLSGNKGIAKRKVIVKKKPTYPKGDGVIYLTFDDGPSNLTSQVLDILDRENVKATFFVISANELTKRAYQSGHTIGLHSNTHNYKYIYTSETNYFQDLKAIQDKVYNVTGYRSMLIRFPGGSSNTVSKYYKKGIMTNLVKEVLNRGYNYFDWNIDSNDAGSDIKNSSKIYSNVISNLSPNKTNVVLLHDASNHQATLKALPDIIAFGKSHGYTFKAITDDTPVVRHYVNN